MRREGKSIMIRNGVQFRRNGDTRTSVCQLKGRDVLLERRFFSLANVNAIT